MKKIFFALMLSVLSGMGFAQSINLPTPAGSMAFGTNVTVLPNGNYVVTDPRWRNGNILDVGAVYLYDGQTNALISTLTGSQADDQVGDGGVTVLDNGNYVVRSNYWNNGSNAYAGAVTFGNGMSGVSGAVSSANSLVGTQVGDKVGSQGITVLSNGNYVVSSLAWRNGNNAYVAGAVTFGSGVTGVTDAVSAANSLIGTQLYDSLGSNGVTALSNGNYVVNSPSWKNGSNPNVGAVTFGSGTTGISGAVSAVNSLVGTQAFDQVGSKSVTALSNGNYVVSSSDWHNGSNAYAGAVTFGSGVTGISGVVSAANSLIGTHLYDFVGHFGITVLSNGNYVVNSPLWDNGNLVDVGAVTFGSGVTGISGVVSAANSLVGTQENDYVGIWGGTLSIGIGRVTALSNGNYVVSSPLWNNGNITDVGAVTFGSGVTGVSGAVSTANSLIGTQGSDNVGSKGVTALRNGNYVVNSPNWINNSNVNAGAVTFGSGVTGVSGMVSAANSLVGTQANDNVGVGGITALSNGNYVVSSHHWKNNSNMNAGAVTFGSGVTGISGVVSTVNSLVGTQAFDYVGYDSVMALSNGNYVVNSPYWSNGSNAYRAGAATLGNGTIGISGVVSSANSLVGTQADDNVGVGGVIALSNGNYVVNSHRWKNGNNTNAGAVTFGNGVAGISGAVSAANSLIGTQADDQVGNGGTTALSNSNYIVSSRYWVNGNIQKAGAITLGNSATGINGTIIYCNSVIGSIAYSGLELTFDYNNTYNNVLVGKPAENTVTLFNTSQMALAMSTTTANSGVSSKATISFVNDSCKLIGTLKSSGSAPIEGPIKASVYIQLTTPSAPTGEAYCRRYYSLLPADSADFKTAKITLYLTQAEFDDYNNNISTTSKLPTNPTDTAGKTALRVTQQRGTSPTGNLGSYNGWAGAGPANVLIIPGDSNVVWNSSLSRWEVSFPVTGFGGFFLSAGNEAPLALPAEIPNTSGITVSPVPATSSLTIANSNAALTGSTVTALNLQGQVMATAVLNTSTQLDVQSWPAGMYLLKFADGSVVRVVKQ